MNDLISIIVPVYNVKKYIEKCVLSICNQTYSNLEIILIDDGSDDGSAMLCDKLAEKDERICVIHQKNQGSTVARNNGLSMARGKYIGFVDSDDWIEAEMYEILYKELICNKAEISIGRQYIDNGDLSQIERPRSIVSGIIRKQDNMIAHHIIYSDDYKIRGISPNLVDKLFKKELIVKHQRKIDIKTKFSEDGLCVYSCLLDADVIALVNKPIYHYCKRSGSITSQKDVLYFEKISLFYNQMRKIFEKEATNEILINKLNRYMIELLLNGINYNLGISDNIVVPFFIPPYRIMEKRNVKSIIIYGAGDVGTSYYKWLTQNSTYKIISWVDKRYEEYKEKGMIICAPDKIKGLVYDAVLIATDSADLMAKIKKYLLDDLYVEEQKIISEFPNKLIEYI